MTTKTVGKIKGVSCDSYIRTHTVRFKWNIEDFGHYCTSSKSFSDYLESPKFSVDCAYESVRWCMRLHPRGRYESHKDYISLYLHSTAKIKASYSLEIYNQQNKVIKDNSMIERDFDLMSGWGFHKMIRQDFVLNPENHVLDNNKLVIGCKITYSCTKAQDVKLKREDSVLLRHCKVLDGLDVVHFADVEADVALVAGGKVVHAHKDILAKSSSVFAAMFNNDMKENRVEIADIRHDVLMELVRFVYVGKVNNIDGLAGQLAIAADKYALDDLKLTCEKTMVKNLSLDNAVECVELAERLRMDQLKDKTVKFVAENARDFVDSLAKKRKL